MLKNNAILFLEVTNLKNEKNWLICGILVVVLVVITGIYFAYKLFYLTFYNDNLIGYSFSDISKSYKINEVMKIEKQNLDDNEYIHFKNIRIRNDFANFTEEKLTDNEYGEYVKYSSRELDSSLTIKTSIPYLNLYYLKEQNFTGDVVKNTTAKDRIRYLRENNIQNDEELFKFLSNDNYHKNIFTSIKDIKGKYATYLMGAMYMSNKIVGIIGDYNGYILEKNDVKEANIIINEKRYVFTFSGEYYSYENINSLLNTLRID